jgi:hypothetical protein
VHVQFAEKVLDVHFDGARAQGQPVADLFIRKAFGDEFGDRAFA